MDINLLPTTVDCDASLKRLLLLAAKTENVILVDSKINSLNFPRVMRGVWDTELGIAPVLQGETFEEAGLRLEAANYSVKNLRSLLAFMAQHPEAMVGYDAIMAIGHHSRPIKRDKKIYVPGGKVEKSDRRTLFLRDYVHLKYGAACGVLVSKPNPARRSGDPYDLQENILLL